MQSRIVLHEFETYGNGRIGYFMVFKAIYRIGMGIAVDSNTCYPNGVDSIRIQSYPSWCSGGQIVDLLKIYLGLQVKALLPRRLQFEGILSNM